MVSYVLAHFCFSAKLVQSRIVKMVFSIRKPISALPFLSNRGLGVSARVLPDVLSVASVVVFASLLNLAGCMLHSVWQTAPRSMADLRAELEASRFCSILDKSMPAPPALVELRF